MAMFLSRIHSFQEKILPSQVVLLSKPADIQYFTGFSTLVPEERETFLLICAQKAALFHTSFSPINKFAGIDYHATTSLDAITKTITDWKKAGTIAANSATQVLDVLLDFTSLFVTEFKVFEKMTDIVISPINQQKIWQLRMVKDELEQNAMQQAAELTKQAFTYLRNHLQIGKTELELAWEIECFIKQRGGTLAFPTIVAYGSHAALPHHQPTDIPLASETAVLFDFGAKVNGYCADMTRTMWFGENPTAEFIKIETAVHSAYDAALAVCTKLVTAQPKNSENSATDSAAEQISFSALDTAARDSLTQAGYGKNYIHTTGHGLGLEIHEQPSVYKTTTTLLQTGMAFTIEPGVYLPEKVGYRYENTILLQKEKVVELTR